MKGRIKKSWPLVETRQRYSKSLHRGTNYVVTDCEEVNLYKDSTRLRDDI